ncbi:hypothetical protein E2C01_000386 [Portunus trituberculatus]|uniref:Uncharacterized protein n=1 Tax=Portunus trituberculatus TaxID=210409 RepID=A0A5B7CE71_PORTR|nr:hypothetical protein [Portunus trituberculatus]
MPVTPHQKGYEWCGGDGMNEGSPGVRRGHFPFNTLSSKPPVKRLLLRLLRIQIDEALLVLFCIAICSRHLKAEITMRVLHVVETRLF